MKVTTLLNNRLLRMKTKVPPCRGSFPRMEEVSSAATGSTVVDLSGDSHLQVRGCWVGGNNGYGWQRWVVNQLQIVKIKLDNNNYIHGDFFLIGTSIFLRYQISLYPLASLHGSL